MARLGFGLFSADQRRSPGGSSMARCVRSFLFIAPAAAAMLAACGSDAKDVDYEAVCRDFVATSHPRLEPRLDATQDLELADGMVTVRLSVPSDPATSARCDIPAGTSDVITSGVRVDD